MKQKYITCHYHENSHINSNTGWDNVLQIFINTVLVIPFVPNLKH